MLIYFLAIGQEKVDTKYPFSRTQMDRKYPPMRPNGSPLFDLKLQNPLERIQVSAGNMRIYRNLFLRVFEARWYGSCPNMDLL